MEITGLEVVLQNLRNLNIDEAIENKAVNKAGKITQDAIKSEANFGKRSRSQGHSGEHSRGIFRENIKLRRPKYGEVIVHSGRAYHAHLIEFGRSGGTLITKGGKRVTWGSTGANPVFGRGFEKSKDDAQQAMVDELIKGLGL
ncbi:HK97-gp10 family putative phage morphogenesis protein [Bacillus sp. 1P02SD]|uniref:HK97-gp10 family putative phage morphogenesis protein n=1 Tax=Bacillus sp. 1P02SD TaxID=3132264 RepID=UPI0039A28923